MVNSIYYFSAKSIDGEIIPFTRYKNKVMLIVNTASNCGFTWHFKGLQQIYEKYNKSGFEILAFPCNQFANQEPATESEISNFCKLNYGVTFQMFEKIHVNGEHSHQVFKYLTDFLPGILGIKSIKWNFTKFLINKEGKPIKRYSPSTPPDKIIQDIERLLNE